MKNQYFGDINDYRKYGVLRALSAKGKLSTAVCWMLTPDDDSYDGNKTYYLVKSVKYGRPKSCSYSCRNNATCRTLNRLSHPFQKVGVTESRRVVMRVALCR